MQVSLLVSPAHSTLPTVLCSRINDQLHPSFVLCNLINPRRGYAERVTVVVSCVCVCLSVRTHAILAVRAIRSITKDAIVLSVRFAAILKWRFP